MARDESALRLSRVKRGIAWSIPVLALVIFMSGRVRTDHDGVRSLVYERLQEYFPRAVLREHDGVIDIEHLDGRRQTLELAKIQAACAGRPRKCTDVLDDRLIELIERLEGRKPFVDPPSPPPVDPVPK